MSASRKADPHRLPSRAGSLALVDGALALDLTNTSSGRGTAGHQEHLRDFDTVRAFEVVTMEEMPRVVLHEGEAVHEILHAWGPTEC